MNKIKTFLRLLILFSFSLSATERLEWSDDENVFEYKVEVKNKVTGEVKAYTTQQNFLDIDEASGEYEFRVKALDLLGREGNSSGWQSFRISRALTPLLTGLPPAVWKLPETSGELATLPVQIQNVSPRTRVQLLNQETNQVVEGQLVISREGDIVMASGIRVPQMESGVWKIKITDPSGRSAESGEIKIESQKEERLKKEALAKAEEQKAALEAEKEALLAAEEAASEAGDAELASLDSGLTDTEGKVFASNAQKIRIEKQIAKRVRGYQKKIR